MTSSEGHDRWRIAEDLLEAARADTSFADLYLERARELLSLELTEAQHAALAELDTEIVNATSRIANAMEASEWATVGELTARVAQLKRTAAERAPLRRVADCVYGFDDVLVDPFSPGISSLAGVPEASLPGLRDAAVTRLGRLRAADPPAADLYDARSAALSRLRLSAAAGPAENAPPTAASLRALAHQALAEGDLARLQELSAAILRADAMGAPSGQAAAAGPAHEPGLAAADLARPFGADVRERARSLGFEPHRVPSTAEQVRARFNPAWRPTLGGEGRGHTVRLSVTIPGETPEALRDTLELLMNRPFVTSAGTRYMPTFVAEDVLVETLPESPPGSESPSPLLELLGLPGRWGLSRSEIERALRQHGHAVVRALALDPRAYRIACLPVDLYTRLGPERGWGRQEIWTHFDGYLVSKERKLMALVGGDARFGGLHDLVAVGLAYDSDRLFARFAVVQRARFATW